jgi:hypothetical protein
MRKDKKQIACILSGTNRQISDILSTAVELGMSLDEFVTKASIAYMLLLDPVLNKPTK